MIEIGDLALCTEGEYTGWIMWRHPDGQWVTMKHAGPYELMAFETIRLLRIEREVFPDGMRVDP